MAACVATPINLGRRINIFMLSFIHVIDDVPGFLDLDSKRIIRGLYQNLGITKRYQNAINKIVCLNCHEFMHA
jgi:hypothetical protein